MSEDANDINREKEQVAQGGTWTDNNLAQPLDWTGEEFGPGVSEDQTESILPETRGQQHRRILSEHSLTSDVLTAITTEVQRKILQSAGSSETSLAEFIMGLFKDNDERVQDWMSKQSDSLSSGLKSSVQISEFKNTLARLDERIASLEEKISTVIIETTANSKQQLLVLQEANNLLQERRATDESDLASEPSIIKRMDSRVTELSKYLRDIEPHVAPAADTVERVDQRRKLAASKFGKRD